MKVRTTYLTIDINGTVFRKRPKVCGGIWEVFKQNTWKDENHYKPHFLDDIFRVKYGFPPRETEEINPTDTPNE